MTALTSKVASLALFGALFAAAPAGAQTVSAEPQGVWGAPLDFSAPSREARTHTITVWGAQVDVRDAVPPSQAQVTPPKPTAPRS